MTENKELGTRILQFLLDVIRRHTYVPVEATFHITVSSDDWDWAYTKSEEKLKEELSESLEDYVNNAVSDNEIVDYIDFRNPRETQQVFTVIYMFQGIVDDVQTFSDLQDAEKSFDEYIKDLEYTYKQYRTKENQEVLDESKYSGTDIYVTAVV